MDYPSTTEAELPSLPFSATIRATFAKRCESKARHTAGMPFRFQSPTAWGVIGCMREQYSDSFFGPPRASTNCLSLDRELSLAMPNDSTVAASDASKIAMQTIEDFLSDAEQSADMNLSERLHAVAAHLKTSGRVTERSWKSAMAKAAGCTPANIRKAAHGQQQEMSADMLRRIARWAGVSEVFMLTGSGSLLGSGGLEDHPDYAVAMEDHQREVAKAESAQLTTGAKMLAMAFDSLDTSVKYAAFEYLANEIERIRSGKTRLITGD